MKCFTEMPDEKLIQFYLGNNPTAMATLTDLYKDRIYNTIYASVKDKYAAEVIFRDVFVRIMNNLIAGKNPEGCTFLKWATETAEQVCLEYNFKAKCTAGHDEQRREDMPADAQMLPENMYYESHTRLRNMIYRLPEGQREVIIMNHYAGTSFRDIATKMKCSVTSALDTMKIALTNLRKLMTEEGMALS
jgi:RNA polymerase sigma factor (sigma-70 family)